MVGGTELNPIPVGVVRAGVEQVLQQEWRRLMRRESLDTTELANACWYGRWRKFDLKKAITSEQTSSWLGVVKGDNHSRASGRSSRRSLAL
jgi:hypothetical protein